MTEVQLGKSVTFDSGGLDQLLKELVSRNFEVFGPQIRNGVVAYDLLRSIADLPVGWTDEQDGGRYRLTRRNDSARFGFAVGPQSLKEFLHPAKTQVWSMTRAESGDLDIHMIEPATAKRAFIGVKPCELAAIGKQDRVLLGGAHPDPAYQANRKNAFVVVVNCSSPASTCFCTSMGTGPAADQGFDLALTELVDGESVRYVADAGSEEGRSVLNAISSVASSEQDSEDAAAVVNESASRITRRLDTNNIKELLYDTLESPHWNDVAERCLACGNCTLACPTCFCTNMEDVTDLSGDNTDRWRVWDSCFSLEFSHLGPGPHRDSVKSRYRQWLTHKLGSWIDQFDESGCVGCGRCITWCPVGIDLTAEVKALSESQGSPL